MLVSVAVVLTVEKAGVRFHGFFEFKVYRLSSLAGQRTVHCAALRGAELVVVFYALQVEASISVFFFLCNMVLVT